MKQYWRQGEHVAIVGPTGTGKTTIASQILEVRGYVVVVAVKRKDETLNRFREQGYRVVKKWPADYNFSHVVYWLRPESLSDDMGKQRESLHIALNNMYLAGSWCIFLDDVMYVCGMLGLAKDVGMLLSLGRSCNISMVTAMVRPTSLIGRIPKEVLNQCSHWIIFSYTEENEIKATANMAGIAFKEMLALQSELRGHECLYINARGRFIVRKE